MRTFVEKRYQKVANACRSLDDLTVAQCNQLLKDIEWLLRYGKPLAVKPVIFEKKMNSFKNAVEAKIASHQEGVSL